MTTSNMQLTFGQMTAFVNGKPTNVSLVDVMNGKIGSIKNISLNIELEETAAPAVPFVDTGANAQAAAAATATTAEVVKKSIKKGSKIEKLFRALMRKGGVTFEVLAKELGMGEGGVGSYLYYYPKEYGCHLESTVRESDKKKVYKLVVPEGIKLTFE